METKELAQARQELSVELDPKSSMWVQTCGPGALELDGPAQASQVLSYRHTLLHVEHAETHPWTLLPEVLIQGGLSTCPQPAPGRPMRPAALQITHENRSPGCTLPDHCSVGWDCQSASVFKAQTRSALFQLPTHQSSGPFTLRSSFTSHTSAGSVPSHHEHPCQRSAETVSSQGCDSIWLRPFRFFQARRVPRHSIQH